VPHIIVEYSEQLIGEDEVQTMLQSVHRSIVDSGLFIENQIKTRAYPFKAFTKGGGNDPYVHIQARIKFGRDANDKKRLGEEILTGFKKLNIQASVITVEIIDMDRESYGKYQP